MGIRNTTTYLDYAASAPLRPEVLETIIASEREFFGNPSSIHRVGQQARVTIERNRKIAAGALACKPSEIVFTSGGSEANNMALYGILKPGDHVVSSLIEHPAILEPLAMLQKNGVAVTLVAPSTDGQIEPTTVVAAIRPNTRMLSIMALNNETGVINDLAAIGTLAREHNILFHTDAVQAFGKLAIDVNQAHINFLSASAHKIGGPRGVGLLFARKGIPLQSRQLGGSQENSHRAGTENVAGIAGFAKAIELSSAAMASEHQRLTNLRVAFLERLKIAKLEYQLNGTDAYPGIINLRFPGAPGQPLVINLDTAGIAVSYGASCSSGIAQASHVLLAMDQTAAVASEAIRISFGYGTSADEVDQLANALSTILQPQPTAREASINA